MALELLLLVAIANRAARWVLLWPLDLAMQTDCLRTHSTSGWPQGRNNSKLSAYGV
jgi:hypothetical protein